MRGLDRAGSMASSVAISVEVRTVRRSVGLRSCDMVRKKMRS